MKHARPPVKVQNERRMASFFVWMAWWCRAVLMHRTRWSFLESLPQPLPKGKGFGAALTGIFFWETKRQRDKESKRRGVKESKRQRVKETKRRRVARRLFDGFEQGLFNGWSMVGQWLVLFFLEGVANFRHGVAKNPDALCGGASGSILHSFELIISCIFKQVSSGSRRKG